MSNISKKYKQQDFPIAEFGEIRDYILDKAIERGMDEVEVALNMSEGLSTTVRLQEVETVEYCKDKGIVMNVYCNHQRGSASSSDLSKKAIDDALNAAIEIAKMTGQDKCFGLADKALFSNEYPELDLYHPWELSADEANQMMKECEALAMQDKAIKTSEGATLGKSAHYVQYANSQGFQGDYATTRHGFHCTLVAEDSDGGMQRDYGYTSARESKQLAEIAEVAEEARNKTLERLGAKKIKTQTVPVIFDKSISTGLLSSLISAISGRNLYQKSSFLLDSLGKQVLPSRYSVYEKPHIIGGLGSCPFDGDGLLTRDNVFIENGEVKSYVLGSYASRRLGLQTTANAGGVNNLHISHDALSFDELLMKMGTGLLVTELMGQGVNITTGLYSRGAFGFWVENGEIQYPVQEITIAGNLKEMLMNIEGISDDADKRKATKCGSVLISSMSIAGE
jgi:PmbA protein